MGKIPADEELPLYEIGPIIVKEYVAPLATAEAIEIVASLKALVAPVLLLQSAPLSAIASRRMALPFVQANTGQPFAYSRWVSSPCTTTHFFNFYCGYPVVAQLGPAHTWRCERVRVARNLYAQRPSRR